MKIMILEDSAGVYNGIIESTQLINDYIDGLNIVEDAETIEFLRNDESSALEFIKNMWGINYKIINIMKLTNENVADVLREKLLTETVRFAFRKKDGSRREAIGTTNLVVIPQDQWPKDMGAEIKTPKNESVVTYYDMEKLSWRSCRADSILEIEGQEVSDE